MHILQTLYLKSILIIIMIDKASENLLINAPSKSDLKNDLNIVHTYDSLLFILPMLNYVNLYVATLVPNHYMLYGCSPTVYSICSMRDNQNDRPCHHFTAIQPETLFYFENSKVSIYLSKRTTKIHVTKTL